MLAAAIAVLVFSVFEMKVRRRAKRSNKRAGSSRKRFGGELRARSLK
jgi:hypothetical protein